MMQKNNLCIGFLGEEEAGKYLQSKGYKIIDRNFKKRYGEIDIIAMDGKVLVFVEVKTRKANLYGFAEDAITPRKIKTLVKSAQYYKLCHPQLPDEMRIDAITVQMSNFDTAVDIKHYQNITG